MNSSSCSTACAFPSSSFTPTKELRADRTTALLRLATLLLKKLIAPFEFLPRGGGSLPRGEIFLPFVANLLPLGGNFLPHSSELATSGKIFLPHGHGFLPRGEEFLPLSVNLPTRDRSPPALSRSPAGGPR